MTQNIIISKQEIKTEFEVLTYKYANAIEGADNAKAVRNVKSDRIDDTADALAVDRSFEKRLKEIVGIMRDFSPEESVSGENVTLTFVITSRWSGTAASLQSLVKTYILDGMLAEWFNVTAPTEAAIYTARLPQDITDIKVELYTKGVPQ